MFKGFTHLENILKASSEVASLDFSTSNARVTSLLSSTRKSVREAAPHERKLFTLVEELGITPREELEPPTPLRGPDPVTVDKILRAANVLAQICNLRDAKEQIELIAQRYEEVTSSIDSLESIMEKQRINLEKVRIAERAKSMEREKVNEKTSKAVKDEQTVKIEDEIRHHEMEILALDMLKQEYTNKINALDDELAHQKCLEEEEIELNKRLRSLLLHNVLSEDLERVKDVLKNVIVTLEQLLEGHRKLLLLEFDIDVIHEVNSTLVDNVATVMEQSDIDMNLSIPLPSSQTILSAREKNWKDSDGKSAIYILVANFLATINHSQKGCPVTTDIWKTY
ncbi:5933_t:CDS:2 [Diversispora eburnea]|uniref:5933_t:CDS:1 n=1 Tax=Diversispora eburnea TaxID=1213867 RepID=A0A9N8ZBU3_9GLOM|nr:5933_t:CDS:2 [Diversispora eburnea]